MENKKLSKAKLSTVVLAISDWLGGQGSVEHNSSKAEQKERLDTNIDAAADSEIDNDDGKRGDVKADDASREIYCEGSMLELREKLAMAVEQWREETWSCIKADGYWPLEVVTGCSTELRRMLKREFDCAYTFAAKYLTAFDEEAPDIKESGGLTVTKLQGVFDALQTSHKYCGDSIDLGRAMAILRETLRDVLLDEWSVEMAEEWRQED